MVSERTSSSNCVSLRHEDLGWYSFNTNTFACYISATSGNSFQEGPAGAQTTEWQHVALTWSDGESMKLYLDGEPQTPGYDAGAVSGAVNSATQVLVGMGERGSSYGWHGLIDDVRIYDRAVKP